MAKNRTTSTDPAEGGAATMPPPQPETPRPRVPQVGDVVNYFEADDLVPTIAKIAQVCPGPERRLTLTIDRETVLREVPQKPRGNWDLRRLEYVWSWIDPEGELTDESPLMRRDRLDGVPRDEHGRPLELAPAEELPEAGTTVAFLGLTPSGSLDTVPAIVIGQTYPGEANRFLDLKIIEIEVKKLVPPGRFRGGWALPDA